MTQPETIPLSRSIIWRMHGSLGNFRIQSVCFGPSIVQPSYIVCRGHLTRSIATTFAMEIIHRWSRMRSEQHSAKLFHSSIYLVSIPYIPAISQPIAHFTGYTRVRRTVIGSHCLPEMKFTFIRMGIEIFPFRYRMVFIIAIGSLQ